MLLERVRILLIEYKSKFPVYIPTLSHIRFTIFILAPQVTASNPDSVNVWIDACSWRWKPPVRPLFSCCRAMSGTKTDP
jgi:hypothetical protein